MFFDDKNFETVIRLKGLSLLFARLREARNSTLKMEIISGEMGVILLIHLPIFCLSVIGFYITVVLSFNCFRSSVYRCEIETFLLQTENLIEIRYHPMVFSSGYKCHTQQNRVVA